MTKGTFTIGSHNTLTVLIGCSFIISTGMTWKPWVSMFSYYESVIGIMMDALGVALMGRNTVASH